MKRITIVLAALAVAATPAAAMAEGVYYLRNDTPRPLTCGLKREHSEAMDRVALRAGGEWSQTTARDGPRTLWCDTGAIRSRYRMRSGVRYALVEDGRGAVWLRIAAGR
jgi:Ni/Co efflux regulator RcnB